MSATHILCAMFLINVWPKRKAPPHRVQCVSLYVTSHSTLEVARATYLLKMNERSRDAPWPRVFGGNSHGKEGR